MVVGFTRKDFLEALFGDYFQKHDGFIMVKCLGHLGRNCSFRYFPNVEVLSRQQYRDEENVFFGVCPREAMKPEARHVRYASAIWAGLDLSSDGYSGRNMYFNSLSYAAKAVRSFPFPPSIIVESGWGMHLYWLFKDVVEITDIEHFEWQLAKINSYFQCKSEVKADTLLRLPGTVNSKKPSREMNCNVKFLNSDFRYDLSDFEDLTLGDDMYAAAANPSAPVDREADEAAEIDAKEIEDFLSRESGRVRKADGAFAKSDSGSLASSTGHGNGGNRLKRSIEPAVYEPLNQQFVTAVGGPTEETISLMVETAAIQTEDLMAEKIAQRVAEILSERFLDGLADKVVEKLVKKTKRGSAA